MTDNVAITPGTGATIAADELTDGVLGGPIKVQYIKIMDGTIDGTNKSVIKAASTAAAATDPALVVAVSPNNYDYSSGTGGSKTQRVIIDSSQISPLGQSTMSASQSVTIASDQSVVTVRYPILVSAGTSQFALAITTNTTLTVPGGTRLAQFSVETADVRYTDDGTSATTTVGQLAKAGSAWQYAGPLASLKFTAVSGSPTINVSYYK